MASIRWLFLDVGNVIFNDDPLMVHVYRSLCQAVQQVNPFFTFGDLMALREKRVLQGRYGHYGILGRNLLGDTLWNSFQETLNTELERNFARFVVVLPGVEQVLSLLATRYHLALAANQLAVCRRSLERRGLLRNFELCFLSAEVGLAKPDPHFFQALLACAGCAPQEGAMIGDRIDNDILPAKQAGLHTVWLPWPLDRKDYRPRSKEGRFYLESLARASLSFSGPRTVEERPDYIITSLDELPEALEKLQAV